MGNDKYLTIDQVAFQFHVHRNTVENWLRSGRLRGVKLGGRLWRISSEALAEFLKKGERNTDDNSK
jgi:excisionase family DNA binding protein